MKATLATIFFTTISIFSIAQTELETEVKAWQEKQNAEFRNPDESPLTAEERERFHGHIFYPIKPEYHVVAKFIKNENPEPFEMKTTGERRPIYSKYGTVEFELNGKKYELAIYQSHQLRTTTLYKNYLFLPFTDLTNGFETYGGGRYLDLTIPDGDTIVIDFNKAYSPSCAFSHNYSCPVPPEENRMKLRIEAGMMNLVIAK